MNPKERVEAILKGEPVDRVPFTAYEDVLPRCATERGLRNEGLCLVARQPAVFESRNPNVETRKVEFVEHGSLYVRTELHTPDGDLSTTTCEMREEGFSWTVDRLFKTPDDYEAIAHSVRDMVFEPAYERMEAFQEVWEGDVFAIADAGYSPFQEIIYSIMGLQTFSVEWSERPDQVLALYEAVKESHERMFPVLAGAPVSAVVYDGNITEDVIGVDRFRSYCVPSYVSLRDALHAKGKKMGVRVDVQTAEMAETIGATGIDFVDGFTPEDSGLNLAEALTVWPSQVIWVNIPPALFARGPEACTEEMRQLMREASPGKRVIFGIAEDVLQENWRDCMPRILEVLNAVPEDWTVVA